jgi:hypothetical protein
VASPMVFDATTTGKNERASWSEANNSHKFRNREFRSR